MVYRPKVFGIYCDYTKKTSGQRFFSELYKQLGDRTVSLEILPPVILFNVSAPFSLMLSARMKGKKVVVRIDSLYFDRLSPAFIQTFPRIVRPILSIGLKWKAAHDTLAFWANLFNRNYGAFVRMIIANGVIYQSKFSEKIYTRYFPRKKRSMIVNGARFVNRHRPVKTKNGIDIALIYDSGRPSKRIYDIVRFIKWANEEKNANIRLAILGYTGVIPEGVPPELKEIVESRPYIKTLNQFSQYDKEISQVLYDSDMYISFSYRDACPNVVVEAMSHGLPVVGLASGGVPDIVGDAGVLLEGNDFAEGFYSPHRFEAEFPSFDWEKMLAAVKEVYTNNEYYRKKVAERFEKELGIDIVADKYVAAVNELIK